MYHEITYLLIRSVGSGHEGYIRGNVRHQAGSNLGPFQFQLSGYVEKNGFFEADQKVRVLACTVIHFQEAYFKSRF